MSEHKAAEKAAKDFFASNKNETEQADIMEDFMWADNLEINAEACSIENGSECEACGS